MKLNNFKVIQNDILSSMEYRTPYINLRDSEDSRPRTLRIPGYPKPSNMRKGKRSKSEIKFGIGSKREREQTNLLLLEEEMRNEK